MKQFLLFFFTLVIITSLNQVNGQENQSPLLRFAVDFGATKATDQADSLNNSMAFMVGISGETLFKIAGKVYLVTGAGITSHKFSGDNYFAKQGNETVFRQVPGGVVNNNFSVVEFRVPFLVSFPVFSNGQKSVAISAGTEANIFLSGTRNYKLLSGNRSETEKFTIDKKIQFPLRLEVSTLNLSKNSSGLFFGFGIKHQLTNYLNTSSFRPFDAFFRVGYQL